MIKKIVAISIIVAVSWSTKAQVAVQKVGTNPTLIIPSAVLELETTTKGFLPPRMTKAQRDAIASPVTGLTVYCTNCNYRGELQINNGTAWVNIVNGTAAAVPIWPEFYVHCNTANPTAIVEVTNPTTGKVWMDRNLGANRAATSYTDTQAYGSLFQWGRGADGHQCVNRYTGDGVTTTTTSLSSTDTPGHSDFVMTSSVPDDWRSPQNTNLWQGLYGINNPCPLGYRLPTYIEIEAERLSWTSIDEAGAYNSPLKWTLVGWRSNNDGIIYDTDTIGNYWTSTVNSIDSQILVIEFSNASVFSSSRTLGASVRCIMN